MTCLTITPDVVREAIDQQADLIITHHPLPFKSLQRITSDTTTGQMLLKLIAANVAIYSAHTAFDSAQLGINQMWADQLGLIDVQPLVPTDAGHPSNGGNSSEVGLEGSGRLGRLSVTITLDELAHRAAMLVGAAAPRRVGPSDRPVRKIGMACGSGGSFLAAARRRGCDVLVTGEATFHTCLEAEACDIGLVLLGHYWSERFAMERLAEQLAGEFSDLAVWASLQERDPVVAVPVKH